MDICQAVYFAAPRLLLSWKSSLIGLFQVWIAYEDTNLITCSFLNDVRRYQDWYVGYSFWAVDKNCDNRKKGVGDEIMGILSEHII